MFSPPLLTLQWKKLIVITFYFDHKGVVFLVYALNWKGNQDILK